MHLAEYEVCLRLGIQVASLCGLQVELWVMAALAPLLKLKQRHEEVSEYLRTPATLPKLTRRLFGNET